MAREWSLERKVVALAFGIVLSACQGDVGPTREPTPLAAGLNSLMTWDDVRARPECAGLEWKVLEHNTVSASLFRSSFENLVVEAGAFEFLGQRGKLRLEFFNDRLVSTWFYPEDAGAALAVLERTGVQVDKPPNGQRLMEDGVSGTRCWTKKDYRGHVYIGWEDVLLSDQMFAWLQRHRG